MSYCHPVARFYHGTGNEIKMNCGTCSYAPCMSLKQYRGVLKVHSYLWISLRANLTSVYYIWPFFKFFFNINMTFSMLELQTFEASPVLGTQKSLEKSDIIVSIIIILNIWLNILCSQWLLEVWSPRTSSQKVQLPLVCSSSTNYSSGSHTWPYHNTISTPVCWCIKEGSWKLCHCLNTNILCSL